MWRAAEAVPPRLGVVCCAACEVGLDFLGPGPVVATRAHGGRFGLCPAASRRVMAPALPTCGPRQPTAPRSPPTCQQPPGTIGQVLAAIAAGAGIRISRLEFRQHSSACCENRNRATPDLTPRSCSCFPRLRCRMGFMVFVRPVVLRGGQCHDDAEIRALFPRLLRLG